VRVKKYVVSTAKVCLKERKRKRQYKIIKPVLSERKGDQTVIKRENIYEVQRSSSKFLSVGKGEHTVIKRKKDKRYVDLL
jgi:hypothetical protein